MLWILSINASTYISTSPNWQIQSFLWGGGGGGGGGGQYDPTPSYTTAGKYLVVVQISNEPLEYKRQREEVT